MPDHIYGLEDVTNISAFSPTPAQMIGTGPYVMAFHVPGEYIHLDRHENWRWDIRDAFITTPTSEEPSQRTIWITAPASCPECFSSETTEASEKIGEQPNITRGFEIYSVLTISLVLGVPLIYLRRKKRWISSLFF